MGTKKINTNVLVLLSLWGHNTGYTHTHTHTAAMMISCDFEPHTVNILYIESASLSCGRMVHVCKYRGKCLSIDPEVFTSKQRYKVHHIRLRNNNEFNTM